MSQDLTFTTPKGTVLYQIDLKGKKYLPVQERVIWFREEHPDWGIDTELVLHTENFTTARAVIYDATGKKIACAHKSQDRKSFPQGFTEKAESGAIGRALALCGYGTQFVGLEFDEGENVVDSPTERGKTQGEPVKKPEPKPAAIPAALQEPDWGSYKVEFKGSWQGKEIRAMGRKKLQEMIGWVYQQPEKWRDQEFVTEFLYNAENYLADKKSVQT